MTKEDLKIKWDCLPEAKRFIMGRPNFSLARIARRMHDMGFAGFNKAEDEQALVIFAMLEFYAEYGDNWFDRMEEFLKQG